MNCSLPVPRRSSSCLPCQYLLSAHIHSATFFFHAKSQSRSVLSSEFCQFKRHTSCWSPVLRTQVLYLSEEHLASPASGAVSKTTWNRGVFDVPSAITWKGGVAFSGYTRAIICLSVSFFSVHLIFFEIFGCSLQNLCSDTSTFCLHSPPNISHIQPGSLLGCSKALFMERSPQQLSPINYYPCWVLLNSLAITTFGKHPEIVPWLERIQLSIFSAEFASSVCTPCSIPATARTRAARSAQAATELFHTSYQPLILIICNHAQFAALLNSLPRD